MPHQCTNCERTFPDGSKEMLSGCPDCGGNKFQFKPSGAVELDDDPSESTPTADASSTADVSETTDPKSGVDPKQEVDPKSGADPKQEVDPKSGADPKQEVDPKSGADPKPTADADDDRPSKEWVGFDRDGSDRSEAAETSTTTSADDDIIEADETVEPADGEDRAQADARRTTVTDDEVADAAAPPDTDSRVIEPQTDEQPDISDLREELNEQFESIKILSPGTYELNLMELYDREEYIISLQEDGRYVIEVPDSWHGDDV